MIDEQCIPTRENESERGAQFDSYATRGQSLFRAQCGRNSPERETWRARLRDWTGRPVLSTLDVGCGSGFLTVLLAELGHQATGIDVAGESLHAARAQASAAGVNVALRRADAERLPFAPASFDRLIERHVIWLLPDPAGACREWFRVLRPGGSAVMVETEKPSHDAAWQPRSGVQAASFLTKLVRGAGFTEVELQPLVDAAGCGDEGCHTRYALHARKPAA